MTGRLKCFSFHSVKGGVGKSALSTMTALAAAQTTATLLIDMDLTGTSLSDVLDLVPPRFPEADGVLQLLGEPTGFLSSDEATNAIHARRDAHDARSPVGAPFLNDYLLFETPSRDEAKDIEDPVRLGWKMSGAPDALRVLPSSALPRDLERILPVVFDEERAAFLEGRLEYLLDALVPATGERVLVIDTPPTIPGLSRAVLSLAIRLGRGGEKRPLAEDGQLPDRLADADVQWQSFIVSTMDWQDLRAAARWLELRRDDELEVVRWLVNRAPAPDVNRQALLREVLAPRLQRPDLDAQLGTVSPHETSVTADAGSVDGSLVQDVCWVTENAILQTIFRNASRGLSAPIDWLDNLEQRG